MFEIIKATKRTLVLMYQGITYVVDAVLFEENLDWWRGGMLTTEGLILRSL